MVGGNQNMIINKQLMRFFQKYILLLFVICGHSLSAQVMILPNYEASIKLKNHFSVIASNNTRMMFNIVQQTNKSQEYYNTTRLGLQYSTANEVFSFAVGNALRFKKYDYSSASTANLDSTIYNSLHKIEHLYWMQGLVKHQISKRLLMTHRLRIEKDFGFVPDSPNVPMILDANSFNLQTRYQNKTELMIGNIDKNIKPYLSLCGEIFMKDDVEHYRYENPYLYMPEFRGSLSYGRSILKSCKIEVGLVYRLERQTYINNHNTRSHLGLMINFLHNL
jgi:hypothetical protein